MSARRYGRFSIDAELVRDFNSAVKRVMGLCIVFRAEHMLHTNRIEYVAASEHFRPVPPGEVLPEYRWVISETDGIYAQEIDPRNAGVIGTQEGQHE